MGNFWHIRDGQIVREERKVVQSAGERGLFSLFEQPVGTADQPEGLTVSIRALVEVEIDWDRESDDGPRECLDSALTLLEVLEYQEGKVGGTAFRFGQVGRTVVSNLPTSKTSEEVTTAFDGVGALKERLQEMAREEWQAEAEEAVERVLKGMVGKIPGETIADALRALADRYEVR